MSQEVLKKLEDLTEVFRTGQIPTLEEHEVHPNLDKSSRENYLYFTLPVSLNFQRSSTALWRSALNSWEDLETQWVFFPEEVVKRSEEELKTALRAHKLAMQPNKHTNIWFRICHTLHNHFSDDPRQVLARCNMDVERILELLSGEHKKDFPYLSGPKLSNYWLFILEHFTDVKFVNSASISIIPDTHIVKASVELGIVEAGTSPKDTELAWRKLLKGTKFKTAELHSILWNWSRNDFKPSV